MSVAPSPRTPAAAVEEADREITVLDDRTDIEDRAVFQWLKGHQLHRGAFHRLVIGYHPLPVAWRARGRAFVSQADAEGFLRRMQHDPTAMRSLRALHKELGPTLPVPRDADLLRFIAANLISRRLWAIEARLPKSRFVTKTNPEAFAAINPKYATSVDFAYIARLEGDQWLRGYVPMRKNVVIGRSGMTLASGFDVGQWSRLELRNLGFPAALLAKIEPFAALPFKNKTKTDVAAIVARTAPVPELTKAEADLCDGAVFSKILGEAAASWNKRRAPGVPEFKALPGGWQTVWLSRFYQEGGRTRVAEGIVFRQQAVTGDYAAAVATLKGYTQYKDRAGQEARLLEAKMPPPLPPKPAAVGAKS